MLKTSQFPTLEFLCFHFSDASVVRLPSDLAVYPLKEEHLKQKTIQFKVKSSRCLDEKVRDKFNAVKIFYGDWNEVVTKALIDDAGKFFLSWNCFKAFREYSYRSESCLFSAFPWYLVNFLTSNSSALSTTTIVVWIVVVIVIIVVVVVLVVVDNVDVVSEACARDHDVDHGGEHEGETDVDHEGAKGEEGKDASVAAAAELDHLVGKY